MCEKHTALVCYPVDTRLSPQCGSVQEMGGQEVFWTSVCGYRAAGCWLWSVELSEPAEAERRQAENSPRRLRDFGY